MRTITATLLATTLVVSSAWAAPRTVSPLPAGKPAGAKEAAMLGPNGLFILLGLGVVIGGITLAVSNNGTDGVTGPTTTSTSTAGLP